MSARVAATALGLSVLLTAAPAHADTLETSGLGAENIASAAGWQAWSTQLTDGTHRLRLRGPDGNVSTPAIGAFDAPVDPAIGTRGGADAINTPASRRLSAIYSRCAGASQLEGCDVYALDLTTQMETKVTALATRAYSETAPSLTFGNWSFVRRGSGPRTGTYSYLERSRSGRLVRLTPTMARETASTQGRMALTYRSSRGFGVQIRKASGQDGALIAASGLESEPTSPQITRYRVGWLEPGPAATRVLLSDRYLGSENRQFPLNVHEAPRTLPAGVRSAAGDASALFTRYANASGIHRIDPAIR